MRKRCSKGHCIVGTVRGQPVKVRDWEKAVVEHQSLITEWDTKENRSTKPHPGHYSKTLGCIVCGHPHK